VADAELPGPDKPPGPTAPTSDYRARLAALNRLVNRDALLAACPPAHERSNETPWISPPASPAALAHAQPEAGQQVPAQQSQAAQIIQNNVELQARAQNYRQVFGNYAQQAAKASIASDLRVVEGVSKPLWFGNALLLARRVSVGGVEYIQGCWLDWAGIQSALLESTRDLLPGARLEAVTGSSPDKEARLLASLPVKLIPGQTPLAPNSSRSPLTFALVAAWACMLLAAIAVGVLLYGAISLSERRGAFVSAVTHEMRTPLTTFKMYSEMLAAGIVTDESKRQQYLGTLCSEANRLSHLVENVLAYARLERGRAARRIERLPLGELLERIRPHLQERAEQAGMNMVVDADESMLQTLVNVDSGAVEQILFNLVDNACKYAGPNATEKLIHLEALPDGKFAMLRVRDHGQGISAEGARRLFKPFSKSAEEAARSAPGIGLGLALCRRLSRSIGGDLQLARVGVPGACFELRLPLTGNGDSAALEAI
jgi:signal transduction histidine kinase